MPKEAQLIMLRLRHHARLRAVGAHRARGTGTRPLLLEVVLDVRGGVAH